MSRICTCVPSPYALEVAAAARSGQAPRRRGRRSFWRWKGHRRRQREQERLRRLAAIHAPQQASAPCLPRIHGTWHDSCQSRLGLSDTR